MGRDTLLNVLTIVSSNYSGCFRVATLFAAVVLCGTAVSAQTNRVGDLHTRAENGDAETQFVLGSMYRAGTVVNQDDVVASDWFRRSAEQGFGPSFLPLARAFLDGNGVPQDFVSAHLWFNIAAARLTGDDQANAVEGRAEVEALMADEQIAEAQRLVRGWAPRDGSMESASRASPPSSENRPQAAAVPEERIALPTTLQLPNAARTRQQVCLDSRQQGRADARLRHGAVGWFIGGLACGVGAGLIGTGVCTAGSALSNPQPHTLADGIDEECYRDGYRARGKRRNILTTLGGSLVGTAVFVAIVVAAIN